MCDLRACASTQNVECRYFYICTGPTLHVVTGYCVTLKTPFPPIGRYSLGSSGRAVRACGGGGSL